MIKRLTLLNETILDHLNEKNEIKIIKAFTNIGIKILDADFAFVWLKQHVDKKWKLVYKTPNLPFEPYEPRRAGMNSKVIHSGKVEFVKKFKDTPYNSYVGKYMKSFVIIPISFKGKAYGTMVFCYKKQEDFSEEKKILSTFLGNGIAQVITIQQSHERTERLKTTATLLAQEKLRTDFLANATHELRTPVAIIKGNVDLGLLRKGKNVKSTHSVLRAIDYETKHLTKILSDLTLITSRKADIKNKLVIEDVDIKSLISKTVERFTVIAAEKNISIIQSKIPPISMKGDKTYLEKMLANLIKNSITYGNTNGHTRISTSVTKKKIEICIQDDGIGIPTEDIPHVFERFYRADKSHQRDGESTGLGLAIVKWVADIHGGTVIVKKLPKGTFFKVVLPVRTKI